MERIVEPELMDDAEQALAYARADFEAAHQFLVDAFDGCFPGVELTGTVLDLGCGPGDITFRFARRFPACTLVGVDGAAAMLALAYERQGEEPAPGRRITFVEGLLPGAPIPEVPYEAIISNSLLHHLHRPEVLWDAVRVHARPGTHIFVADLCRPPSLDAVEAIVAAQMVGEPEVLRTDFYNSLLAAFTPAEIRAQLAAAGLAGLSVKILTDRHLVVYGTVGAEAGR